MNSPKNKMSVNNKKMKYKTLKTIHEIFPLKRANQVLRHCNCLTHTEFRGLKTYISQAEELDNGNGSIEVQWRKKEIKGMAFGRLYPHHPRNKLFLMMGMSREMKESLIYDLCIDIDFVNSHPLILKHLCKKHDIACSELETYCEHRELAIKEVMKEHEVSREIAKKLFSSILYGGAYDTWKNDKENDVIHKKPSIPFVDKFKEEIKTITKILKGEYPEINIFAKNLNKLKKNDNEFGTTMSYILAEKEDEILQFLWDKVEADGWKVNSPSYDGLLILKDEERNFDVKHYESLIREHFEFPDFGLKEKPMERCEAYTRIGKKSFVIENDDEAAEHVYNDVKKKIIRQSDDSFFIERNHLYNPLSRSEAINRFKEFVRGYDIKKDTGYGPKPYSKERAGRTNIATNMIDFVPVSQSSFYDLVRSTGKHKICFKNGVLDFKTKKFTKWENYTDNIYPIHQISYNYEPCRDETLLNQVKFKIFDNVFGEEKAQKILAMFARMMAGHMEEKKWYHFQADRDSGKGVIQECLMEAFESYVKSFDSSYLQKKKSDRNGHLGNDWCYHMAGSRIMFCNEIDQTKPIDGNEIKNKTGGDKITCRLQHEKKQTSLYLEAQMIIFNNSTLDIQPSNCCKNRILIDMPYTFGDEEDLEKNIKKADPEIKVWVRAKKVKLAFIQLLLDHYSITPPDYTEFIVASKEDVAFYNEDPMEVLASKLRFESEKEEDKDGDEYEYDNEKYDVDGKTYKWYISARDMKSIIKKIKGDIIQKKVTKWLEEKGCKRKRKQIDGLKTNYWFGVKSI